MSVSSVVTPPFIVVRGILDVLNLGDLLDLLNIIIGHDASITKKDDESVKSALLGDSAKDGESLVGTESLHVLVEPHVEDGKILAGHDTDTIKVTVKMSGPKLNTALLTPDITTFLTGLKHDSGTIVTITIEECT